MSLPHKCHLCVTTERTHGQMLFSRSSRGMSSERATRERPPCPRLIIWFSKCKVETSDLPTVNLGGELFPGPYPISLFHTLPILEPLLVIPLSPSALHDTHGYDRKLRLWRQMRAELKQGPMVSKTIARSKLEPCFSKGLFFYWVWRMRYDGISLKISKFAEVTFLLQLRNLSN